MRAHPRAGEIRLGLVAMRIKEHTHATEHLQEFLATLGQRPVASLRDTQNYIHLAAHGLTLWDVASTRFQGDREQWEPIVTWVN